MKGDILNKILNIFFEEPSVQRLDTDYYQGVIFWITDKGTVSIS